MTAYPPVQKFIDEESEKGFISPYKGLQEEEVIGSFAEIEGTDWAVITGAFRHPKHLRTSSGWLI